MNGALSNINGGIEIDDARIGEGIATVNGPLTFERPVKLYISYQAKVAGPISGAEAVTFTGAAPPNS